MKRGGTVCGAVSLTVIFCALCMATFAALTFVTANRERVLAELDAQRAAEFYRADRDATRIAAELRRGTRDFSGDAPEIRYAQTGDGLTAEFSIPAGGEQRLDALLLLRDGGMDVLRWKKVYAGDWRTDDALILADIDDFMTLADIN